MQAIMRKNIVNEDRNITRSLSFETIQRINAMRARNEFCDATIQVSTGMEAPITFNIHRNILSAASNFFEGFYRFQAMTENTENKLLIEDIQASDIASLIEFAYLRDVNGVNCENCFLLMTLADFFGFSSLLRYCVDFIIKNLLTPNNCIAIYFMLDKIDVGEELKRLKNAAWIGVLSNFLQIDHGILKILPLDTFKQIISDDDLNVKDEQHVWNTILTWVNHRRPERLLNFNDSLLKSCRLGLLPQNYFMEQVKCHPYVTSNPTLRPTIINVIRFFNDLHSSSDLLNIPKTPDFALPRFPHEILFAIGGWSNGAPQSFIEAYDSRSDRWNRIRDDDPVGPRAYHGTIALNQTLFCIGGFNGTEYFNNCSKYDPEIKTWKEIAPMHSRRCYVSVTEVNGTIFALGGYDGQSRLRTVEKYTPSTNQWTFVSPMNFQRSDADACSFDGKIYICGGFNGHECLNTAEYYNPEIDKWTLLPSMSIRRSGVSCVCYDGIIYVIGGFNGTHRMSSGEKFDLRQNGQWSPIANMFYPRSNFGLEVIDDGIMAVGGYNGTMTIKHCEVYNPEKNEWLHATDMEIIRSALTVTSVKGLVNKKDFIYQNRENLFSERCRHINNVRPFSDGENPTLHTISLPQAPAVNIVEDEDEEDFEDEEEMEFDLEL